MFTAEVDAGLAVHEPYPTGEAGIQKSLAVICKKVREGSSTAAMKSYAGNVLREAGFPKTAAARAAAMLDHVRRNVAYAHDAMGTEMIQSAMVSLCVDGAPICIPIGDCFPEGTLLLRRDGQLVPIENIEVGSEIWGHDKWVKVEAKVFKGRLKVDAIEMNNGSTMYLTPDHHVYAGDTFDRIRVSELQVGMRMLQPERVAFGGQAPDPDRMYVEALALADGWVINNHRFAIAGCDNKRKEAQKHEVQQICERLDIETLWHSRYITVKDSAWAQRLMQLGERARFKHLETLDLGEAAAAAALRGLMADSTQNTNGPGRTYSTTSYRMMVQVRVLHRMFGVSTSVRMLTPEQHGGAGKHPLWRVGVRAPGERADKILKVRSIERCVAKVPCWDIQTTDHHVYLPEHDVTVSQCDDLVTALATLCGAAGMDVVVVRQFFGDGHQQHVLCEVKLENGKWFPLDPSSSTMPAGQKAKAVRETRSSPWDESITGLSSAAEFVGIGALPVFLYGRDGWAEVRDFDASGLGAEPDRWAEVGQNVQVPLPPGKVVLWEGGWWYRDPATGVAYQWSEPRRGCSSCGTGALATVGTGALLDDMTAALKFSMDPIALIKQFWSRIQGRSWDQALTSAHGRAIAGNWPAGDQAAREDLITLIVSSAMNMKLLRDKDDVIAADNLGRTWVILADRMGIKNPTPGELAHMKQQGSLTGLAEMYVVLIAAIGIIMQGIVTMGIIVALLYFASQVIDDVLSKIVCERELMRIHAEYNKVIDKRLAGGGSSADEKDIADKLDAQQRYVAAGCTKPKPGFDWWPLAIGASIVGVTILGVAYAPEIKQLLGKKSAA